MPDNKGRSQFDTHVVLAREVRMVRRGGDGRARRGLREVGAEEAAMIQRVIARGKKG